VVESGESWIRTVVEQGKEDVEGMAEDEFLLWWEVFEEERGGIGGGFWRRTYSGLYGGAPSVPEMGGYSNRGMEIFQVLYSIVCLKVCACCLLYFQPSRMSSRAAQGCHGSMTTMTMFHKLYVLEV
jgi:hypothetical protein